MNRDAIEDAAGLLDDGSSLGVGVALAEQAIEHGARADLLRQRLRRRAPRHLRALLRRRHFERRQARLLTDGARRELVGRDAVVLALRAGLVERHAREPRLLDVLVRLRVLGGSIAKSRDDRESLTI